MVTGLVASPISADPGKTKADFFSPSEAAKEGAVRLNIHQRDEENSRHPGDEIDAWSKSALDRSQSVPVFG